MLDMKQDIQWGTKARLLEPWNFDYESIPSTLIDRNDFQGWIIEFFGESTRAAIAFEREVSNKLKIPNYLCLEIYFEDVTIEDQAKIFNDTLKKLKVLTKRGRKNKYGFFKYFKNGKRSKTPVVIEATNEKEATDKFILDNDIETTFDCEIL